MDIPETRPDIPMLDEYDIDPPDDEEKKGMKRVDEDLVNQIKKEASETGASGAIAQLMSVPGVAELLARHRKGQKSMVLDEEEIVRMREAGKRQEPEEPQEPDWKALQEDPVKMAKEIEKRTVGRAVSVFDGALNKAMGPLIKTIQTLAARVEKFEERETTSEIVTAAKKYPDMVKYKAKMEQLHDEHPTLDVEELYFMAKRKSRPPQDEMDEEVRGTASERPSRMQATNTSSRLESEDEEDEGLDVDRGERGGRSRNRGIDPSIPKNSKAYFASALSRALGNLDTSQFSEVEGRGVELARNRR